MPRLTANDRALILTKHHANRLSFAVLLAFFRERGRFPRRPTEIERALVNEITAELRNCGSRAPPISDSPCPAAVSNGTALKFASCWVFGRRLSLIAKR